MIHHLPQTKSLVPTRRFFIIGLALAYFSAPANADTILLKNGDFLNGTVTALHDDGHITLNTPLSQKPLTLKSDFLNQITFEGDSDKDSQKDSKKRPHELLTLNNGDTLPVTLSEVGANTLTIDQPTLGKITVPRHHINQIAFDSSPRKLIYQGPTTFDKDWKEVRGISYQNGHYLSSERGQAALPDILPRNFAIDFTLQWQRDQHPNLRLHTGSAKNTVYTNGDWYYLGISQARISINQKNTANRQQVQKLSGNNFTLEDFTENKMDVSLRCNRDKKIIHLYINGNLVDSIFALQSIPKGNTLIIESLAGGDSYNEITSLVITEWNETKPNVSLDERQETDQDAFLDTEGSLYTGELLKIVENKKINLNHKDHRAILFKNPHSKEPLEVGFKHLSQLYFSQKKPAIESKAPPYRINLKAGGSLQISTPRITDNTLSAEHPILHEIKLPTQAIKNLTLIEK